MSGLATGPNQRSREIIRGPSPPFPSSTPLLVVDSIFQERQDVLKLTSIAFVRRHEVFVRFQDEAGVFELRAVAALKVGRRGSESHREIAGVDCDESVQTEITDKLEVSQSDSGHDYAARRILFPHLERRAGKNTKKRAVHARALLKVQDETRLP